MHVPTEISPVNYILTDGNAFEVVAGFQRAARLAGWTTQQIKVVTKECMAGDYHHLICTLATYCAG